MPWNQQTMSGWIAETLLSDIAVVFYSVINNSFLTLFAAICEFHRSFYKLFRAKVQYIDEVTQKRQMYESKMALFGAIQFHVWATK